MHVEGYLFKASVPINNLYSLLFMPFANDLNYIVCNKIIGVRIKN